MKKLFISLLIILMTLTTIGCGEAPVVEEPIELPEEVGTVSGLYVLNEGNKGEKIFDYKGSKLITLNNLDVENNDYVVGYLNDVFNLGISVEKVETIEEVATKLLGKEVDGALINEDYFKAVVASGKYEDITNQIKEVWSLDSSYKDMTSGSEALAQHPFSIYAMGSDERQENLTTDTRFDTNLILTINPLTRQIIIVGIPRDSYVENPAYNNGPDKLTHLGKNGEENALKAVEKMFDMEIDNYVRTNFIKFEQLIDEIGGIDLYNPDSFWAYAIVKNASLDYPYKGDLSRTDWLAGQYHMSGPEALFYARERKDLKFGDLSRIGHGTIVMEAIVNKLLSSEILDNADIMIDFFLSHTNTNISKEEYLSLVELCKASDKEWNIVLYHPWAEEGSVMSTSYKSEGFTYFVDETDLKFVRAEINKVLNGEKLEQKKMPSEEAGKWN